MNTKVVLCENPSNFPWSFSTTLWVHNRFLLSLMVESRTLLFLSYKKQWPKVTYDTSTLRTGLNGSLFRPVAISLRRWWLVSYRLFIVSSLFSLGESERLRQQRRYAVRFGFRSSIPLGCSRRFVILVLSLSYISPLVSCHLLRTHLPSKTFGNNFQIKIESLIILQDVLLSVEFISFFCSWSNPLV